MDLLKKVQQLVRFRKFSVGMERPLVKKDLETAEFSDHDHMRLRYYLGNFYEAPQVIRLSKDDYTRDAQYNRVLLTTLEGLIPELFLDRLHAEYCFPLVHSLSLLPDSYETKPFLTQLGDVDRPVRCKGVIAQARQLGDSNVVLQKFLPTRFWKEAWTVKDLDVRPYQEKKNQVVWRGATTNSDIKSGQTRQACVERYHKETKFADIGFSAVVHGRDHLQQLVKPRLSVEEQLQSKFLLALEGNDVASSLAWMLRANSVVMMARPTVTSWLMEDQLEPHVHYLPLQPDFSDLEETVNWALENEEACLEISSQASQYVARFMTGHKEVLLECEVMRRYLDNAVFEFDH
ncbi:glycosyl transferase family 90 [Rhodovibrionaceae bacterium A322]